VIDAMRIGVLLGLTLSVLIGPVFFALLQTSIHRGFRFGVALALGIAISDSLYIAFTNFFLARIPDVLRLEFWLALVGGGVLVVIGIRTFLKKPPVNQKDQLDKTTHDILDEELEDSPSSKKIRARWSMLYRYTRMAVKGFLLNVMHPGVLLFWISVIGIISANTNNTANEKLVLYGTTIFVVFSTDVLKSYLASRIRKFLTYSVMLWLNRAMGIILIAFGIGFWVWLAMQELDL
jgi:threonine/homoserine/homoserine lactone efflux protein